MSAQALREKTSLARQPRRREPVQRVRGDRQFGALSWALNCRIPRTRRKGGWGGSWGKRRFRWFDGRAAIEGLAFALVTALASSGATGQTNGNDDCLNGNDCRGGLGVRDDGAGGQANGNDCLNCAPASTIAGGDGTRLCGWLRPCVCVGVGGEGITRPSGSFVRQGTGG